MITPNLNYANLKDSYLFYNIAQKKRAFKSRMTRCLYQAVQVMNWVIFLICLTEAVPPL